jgi:hypothetical protein
MPNLSSLPNEIVVALISSGSKLCRPYLTGMKSLLLLFHRGETCLFFCLTGAYLAFKGDLYVFFWFF